MSGNKIVTFAKYRMIASNGVSLHFVEKSEQDAFLNDYRELLIKHDKKLREKYGYWDSNEDAYVKEISND